MIKSVYLFIVFAVIFRISTINYSYPEGKKIRLSTRITSEPVEYENSRYIKFNGLAAYIDLYPEINYGDTITIEGLVANGQLKQAKVLQVKEAGGLYSIRQKIISVFRRGVPEPHASLLSGIVLGSKEAMPKAFWEALKKSGTAHVVVASGMNVTLVTSFLVKTLVHLINRRKAIVIAIAGAWVYVFLSGFDAPLVRAATMGSIAFSAQALGRLSTAFRALVISAALMLIFKPEWAYDLGFILSTLATGSLIIFEPKIYGLISKVPFLFKKDLATTIAAQIGVTPVLLVFFGSFNPLSPLINALVLWTIPPIMIIGALSALVGLLLPEIARVLVMLSLPFSFWFVEVINLSL